MTSAHSIRVAVAATWGFSLFLAISIQVLPAQSLDGPYWSRAPLPGNLIAPITAVGSVISMRTPTEVQCWTGIHRRWLSIPASAAASVNNSFNDMLIVQEGTTISAFCARTATVDVLTVSPGATLDVGPPFSSWTAAVLDGQTAYAFSAFLGRWVAQPLQSANATLSVGTHAAIVHDGVNAYAFSTFFGTWVSTLAPADATASASSMVGLVQRPNEVRAFAAQTNAWSIRALAGANLATVTAQRGYVLLTLGTEALFFSGYTQEFFAYAGAIPLGVFAGADVAALVDLGQVALYAAPVNRLQTLASAAPNLFTTDELIVVQDAQNLYGFSGATGDLSAPLSGGYTPQVFRSAALATSPQDIRAFNLLDTTWVTAPSRSYSATTMLRDAVVLTHATGFSAFAVQSGQWHDLATTPGTIINQDATFISIQGNQIDHFDAARARWTQVATLASPVASLFRTITIADDGFQAYGHGLFHGTWETITLPSPATARRASSECGFVTTATEIFTFAGYGSLSNLSRFPEFTRYAIRGTPLRVKQVGEPGSFVWMGISLQDFDLGIPGLGQLEIDLTGATLLPLGFIPASGMIDLFAQLPTDPIFNGVRVHVQNLVAPPSGSPYLTNSIRPIIL